MKFINYSFILICLVFVACSDYNKVLKSPNPELKYTKALEYYEAEEYLKAQPLLEEILPLYKGTDKGQEIYFYYAYTNYFLGDLIIATYHFKNYASTFPLNEKAQEALYMSAYCNYLDSPNPSLDQTPTKIALEELQVFVNTYPQSDLVDSANSLVDELNYKLEVKDFLNSKQYYKIRRYKSTIVALNDFLSKYPSSEFAEEAKFTIVEAYYYLAINSIESKKLERFDEGMEAYIDFIDNFADGSKSKDAQLIYTKLVREREKFLQENPNNYEF